MAEDNRAGGAAAGATAEGAAAGTAAGAGDATRGARDAAGHGPPAGGAPAAQGHGYGAADVPRVDVRERGGKGKDGEPQLADRRLFVQLLAFEIEPREAPGEVLGAIRDGLAARHVPS